MVFQNLALWPHLTSREHLMFVLEGKEKKIGMNQLKEKTEGTLNLVRLPAHLWENYPHQLSGGEQQRLAIGRVLVQAPEVLLLDEPFSNLDEIIKKELKEELHNLKESLAVGIIYVTHNYREITDLADRVIIMDQGSLIQEGSFSEIVKNPKNDLVTGLIR